MSKNPPIAMLMQGSQATRLSVDAMQSVNELVYKLARKTTFEEALDAVSPASREELAQIEKLKRSAEEGGELN